MQNTALELNMEKRSLTDGIAWHVKGIAGDAPFDIQNVNSYFSKSDPRLGPFDAPHMPMDVHGLLMEKGIIENPNIRGDSSDIQWISDHAWIYLAHFPGDQGAYEKARLILKGIDTFADVYLNGEFLGSCQDVYLPAVFPVTGRLQQENTLVIYVKSPLPILESIQVREDLKERIPISVKWRVLYSAYSDYVGPKPRLIHMGIFDDLCIEAWNERILHLDVDSDVDLCADTAHIHVTPECDGGDHIRLSIYDPDGILISEEVIPVLGTSSIAMEHPRLWWPRSMGDQPMYTVKAQLFASGNICDCTEKKIGLRDLKMIGDFDFRMNGLPLKLWGACLMPLDSSTGCYSIERLHRIIELAELASFNCFRSWGEDGRLPDAFYEACDKHGIMVWQDFFTSYAVYDTNPEMEDLMKLEAECQVRRLKHHPCILLWCGGNESLMHRDYEFPDLPYPNLKIFTEIFPEVCHRLDPGRYYHVSSPYGGAYANDPLHGDTHGYTHIWYVPGNMHPNFLSENCRVSTPALRAMKVMMKPEDLWPEGYDGLQKKNSPYPWPEVWNKYNSNFGYVKLGEIERFYDAEDLDSMLYRIGWGHGYYIRSRVERYRRGYPIEQAPRKERITKGHLLWAFNNSCNHIFFGVIDYFCEPFIAYYSLRRAYSPVLLSFDVGNFINLWLTNDTITAHKGTYFVQLFDPLSNRPVKFKSGEYCIEPDESKPICSLDDFGQFKSNCILHAWAVDQSGEKVAESIDYCQLERQMRFPEDGTITASVKGDELVLSTDRYARSVEILGFDEDGNEFGWLFEDNYFDMIPGFEKRVRIVRGKPSGKIVIKAYYFKGSTQVSFPGSAS